jgi:hypothetical protein
VKVWERLEDKTSEETTASKISQNRLGLTVRKQIGAFYKYKATISYILLEKAGSSSGLMIRSSCITRMAGASALA